MYEKLYITRTAELSKAEPHCKTNYVTLPYHMIKSYTKKIDQVIHLTNKCMEKYILHEESHCKTSHVLGVYQWASL